MKSWIAAAALFGLTNAAWSAPEFLDERFELPAGFRIYRAAGPELSGGSYDLCFDGEGRLLVGDGNAVRRLVDKDADGVFDSFEVIASGLGPRGPQGLLVDGDRLFAVGGDGVQVFEGYRSGGPLAHRGRIGAKFNTGGDHDAHTILRERDGYLYLMAGNGAGIGDRKHITESTSSALFEREASVFRISPDGTKWECIASGGRNPPSLGINYIGDFFSFDSDMEWHVGLPWYRPVRLNHWAIGGDQGWQEVGAYPPYYIDCLPGTLDVGRGSPTWGTFYEHSGLPEKYRNAFIVCDYRWKRESNDQYSTTGRLLAFFLTKHEAGWSAKMEVLARPKPNARDRAGKPIQFALVDVEVAPDGSLFVSDHNQGIWRILYDTANQNVPARASEYRVAEAGSAIDQLLSLPQPGAEYARVRASEMRKKVSDDQIRAVALKVDEGVDRRLEAIRELAPEFQSLDSAFISALAKDSKWEIRAQAAWLLGIKKGDTELLRKLLRDPDPFVRRRAAEAFTRLPGAPIEPLIAALADPVRLVRYVSMIALAHHPASQWLEPALAARSPQAQMRALVAAHVRREKIADETARFTLDRLIHAPLSEEDHLDLLRCVALLKEQLGTSSGVSEFIATNFPSTDRNIRWEQIRLLGEFRVSDAFSKLLRELESDKDNVTQFHIAQALAKLESGWSDAEEVRLVKWFLATQEGWFAQFAGKGVEFPLFWQTVLSDFAKHHAKALLAERSNIDFTGLLGGAALDLMASSLNGETELMRIYSDRADLEIRKKVVRALRNLRSDAVSDFLRREYSTNSDRGLRAAVLQTLANQKWSPANLQMLAEGLQFKEAEVVRACASAIASHASACNQETIRVAVNQIQERTPAFHDVEGLLMRFSGEMRAGYAAPADMNRRPDLATHATAVTFWKEWYGRKFGKAFEPLAAEPAREKPDEEVHAFVLKADLKQGNAGEGVRIYERLQCMTCHGGGVTPGQEGKLFGPDLAGVARRLTRQELADALVYPSKQVADRFKAYEVELEDATPLSGFITEQDEKEVTLADREQVHRIPRPKIRAIKPQSTSLMPERLLNSLSWDEINDLLAFLDEGLTAAGK